MDKQVCELLTDRFKKSIRKSFTPCPLIGEKWFRTGSKKSDVDFVFLGSPKLAKAMGLNVQHIAQTLVKNLSFKGLDAKVEITPESIINVRLSAGKKNERGESKDEPASDD